jgi:hypothetical protein
MRLDKMRRTGGIRGPVVMGNLGFHDIPKSSPARSGQASI